MRSKKVRDLETVLGYDFQEFYEFCQDLCRFGYRPEGFAGRLQAPAELVKHQVGNCWDQTELQREWFERHGYRVRTYLLYYYISDENCPSHSILVYEEDGRWVWFEPMFCGTAVEYSGVHKYGSRSELLADLRRVFVLNGQQSGWLPEKLDAERWELYEYTRPKYGLTDGEFYAHCQKGKAIKLALAN